jgi:hypothetical protein
VACDLGVEVLDQAAKVGFEEQGEGANPPCVLGSPRDVGMQVLVAPIDLVRVLHEPTHSENDRPIRRRASLSCSRAGRASEDRTSRHLTRGEVALKVPPSGEISRTRSDSLRCPRVQESVRVFEANFHNHMPEKNLWRMSLVRVVLLLARTYVN